MKKIGLYGILMTVIMMLSCEREGLQNEFSTFSHDNMLVEEKNWTLDSLIFDYLYNFTPDEKYEFWINKWNEAKTNNSFNDQQKQVVQVLIDSLKITFFENNVDSKLELDNFESMWNQLSLSVNLNKNQKRYLVAAIGGGLDDPYKPSMGDCECSQNSDYCWWWGECSISCNLGGNRGCGFLFRHPCDGVCH